MNDRAGNIRSGMVIAPDGAPGVFLYDGKRLARLALTLSPSNAPSLVLRHSEGMNPVGMLIDDEGRPSLDLFARDTKAGLSLTFSGNGTPGIKMTDPRGMVRGQFSLVQQGEPLFELYDAAGKPRATLGSATVQNEKTGAPETRPISSFLLLDETGKVVFAAPKK
jgi:hypothetical protein